jgi:hypothetical protein
MFNLDTFNGFIYNTVSEVVQQNTNLFNEASHNTIRMIDGYNVGDTDHETFFEEIPGMIKRRDPYSDGVIAAKDLVLDEQVTVKVAGGTYPINIPPSKFRWIKKEPEEGALLFGEQFAAAMPQDQLNAGIACAVAGLTQIGAPSAEGALDGVFLDLTGLVGTAKNISRINMNKGAGYFGDARKRISAWVMHSSAITKLFGDALENTNDLFTIGDVNVMDDRFGRIYFVTDSPSLDNGDGTFNTLGLADNAIVIENNGDIDSNIENANGNENIKRTIQAEWSFNVGLKGMKWASTDVAPTDAALATPANWAQAVTDIKNAPGVLIKHTVDAV